MYVCIKSIALICIMLKVVCRERRKQKKSVQNMEKASDKAPFKRNERNFAQVFS